MVEPRGETGLRPWAHRALPVTDVTQVLLRGKLFGVYNTSFNLPGKLFQGFLGRLANLSRAWALVHLGFEWEGLAG